LRGNEKRTTAGSYAESSRSVVGTRDISGFEVEVETDIRESATRESQGKRGKYQNMTNARDGLGGALSSLFGRNQCGCGTFFHDEVGDAALTPLLRSSPT